MCKKRNLLLVHCTCCADRSQHTLSNVLLFYSSAGRCSFVYIFDTHSHCTPGHKIVKSSTFQFAMVFWSHTDFFSSSEIVKLKSIFDEKFPIFDFTLRSSSFFLFQALLRTQCEQCYSIFNCVLFHFSFRSFEFSFQVCLSSWFFHFVNSFAKWESFVISIQQNIITVHSVCPPPKCNDNAPFCCDCKKVVFRFVAWIWLENEFTAEMATGQSCAFIKPTSSRFWSQWTNRQT